jgi:hypothetical protein
VSSNPPACIVLTTLQWFEECLARGCTVFDFPPGHEPLNIRKLREGSVCLILAKPASGRVPRSEWVFVGEFTVKNVRFVRGEEFSRYASRAVEAGIPFPRPGEASWILEFDRIVRYEKPVKLADCGDIKTSRKPLSEWAITGFTFIRSEDAPRVLEAIRSLSKVGRPSHEELVEELLDLGEWLNFVVRKEDPTPDGVYKLDVTWREAEGHVPLKAFEIEISGDVDRALSRLAHARDTWGCEQLWLIVSDEAKTERAEKLIEPRLRGSFARIKDRVKILGWEELHEAYTTLKHYKKLLKSMSKRG